MNTNFSTIPLFLEEQKFRQIWIWLVILLSSGILWYIGIMQFIMDTPMGQNPMPDVLLVILWGLLGIGMPVMFYLTRLTTEVRQDGIYIRFVPFHFRWQKIEFGEILECRAVTYRPIAEYGGWGIRYGRNGKAYNVSGNRGVRLELKNDKHLLIGSAHSDELNMAIEAQLKYYRH